MKGSEYLSIFPLLVLGLAAPAAAQSTWHCDVAAAPGGDGSAMAPFASIEEGIQSAADGDLVLAAPGTYFECLDFAGKGITLRGAGAGQTIVDGSMTCSVVQFVSGEGPDSRLESLTVRNGLGEVPSPGAQPLGGGLLILGGSPTISDCTLAANGLYSSSIAGTLYGGGAYILNGAPSFLRTTFLSNRSCSGGGAVAIEGQSPATFDECTFSFNSTNSFPGLVLGGAVYSVAGAAPPVFRDCTFDHNQSDRGGAIAGPALVFDSFFTDNQSSIGGAVYDVDLLERCQLVGNNAQCYFGESGLGGGAAYGSVLRDCAIQFNRATLGGGVLSCTVQDSTIAGNSALYDGNCNGRALGGGAMDSVLERCVVEGNDVEKGFGPPFSGEGGGVYGGSAAHCLIRDNFADQGGGAAQAELTACTLTENGVRLDSAGGFGVTARNCIFYGDLGMELDSASQVSWSLVEGGAPGVGNVDADPAWTMGASGTGYDLSSGSPAVDAGDPSSAPDGDGSRADMGAFPTDQSYPGSPSAYCVAKETSSGCLGFVTWSGRPSIAAPTLRVFAGGVEARKNGLLIFGSAPAATPFFGGTLCVQAPIARTPIQNSGAAEVCGGSFDFRFRSQDLTRLGTGPSDSLFAQYWYRDRAASDGTGVALTDAIEFTILP